MILSDQERERFAAYLEEDARTNELLIQQLQKVPGTPELSEKLRAESVACRVVAAKLRAVETQTI